MQERLAHSLSSERWTKKDDRIVVAVSGGADSVVLLRLLHQLKYDLVVAHCNFQLRGEESDGDADFVQELCASLKIPCHVRVFHTRQFAITSGLSIQEAARKLRYDWFEQVRQESKSAFIATAHHSTDHIETLLINQIRGTGIQGYTGIQHRLANHIIRPLLEFESDEIRSFAASNNWTYREDSSNDKDEYLRNHLRHHVIPILQSIDGQIGRTFRLNSDKVLEHLELHNHLINKTIQGITRRENGQLYIQIEDTKSYPQPHLILYRILNSYGFNHDQCKQMVSAKNVGATFRSTNHTLVKDRTHWILSTHNSGADHLLIHDPGKYLFTEHTILVDEVHASRTIERDANIIYIDPTRVTQLHVRHWQNGDRIQPFGMLGSKLLSDVFTDHKIAQHLKTTIPILTDQNDQIIWVTGLCFSEKFKLKLSAGRLASTAWRIRISRIAPSS